MKYSELLNYQGYITLNSIYEPSDNSLVLDIDLYKVNGNRVDEQKVECNSGASYGSIGVDEALPNIRIQWNEGFTVSEKYEIFECRVFLWVLFKPLSN